MTELSKRLRQPCHMLDCLMARNQAADEIERLRRALDAIAAAYAADPDSLRAHANAALLDKEQQENQHEKDSSGLIAGH